MLIRVPLGAEPRSPAFDRCESEAAETVGAFHFHVAPP